MTESVPKALLKRLESRLQVTPRHVHRLINKRASESFVSNRAGALLLARDLKINFQQFASAADLAEIRGAPAPAVHMTPDEIASSRTPKSTPSVPAAKPIKIKTTRNNSVFVVHGRDSKLNEDMFALLRSMGLNPMEWSKAIAAAKGANPNVGDVINNAMKQVQAVIVMFSPDEEARLKSNFCSQKEKTTAGKLASQARPNVIFEAGLALGAHPDKTLLIQVGDTRAISDIAGKHMLHLSNSASSRKELAQRLSKLKFKVDLSGTSWITEGNFDR
ncbi:TIR domain-containing protein [Afipia felis]|uniref:Predicted nucleotide-binding protein containing TIR-like domain n=2 Tax=Afipia felis TaxID=1035 RepID=A0A380W674_AFIFE|nr:nucleotide-binding protein [Afipia felis]EKS27675.1 hypothetical protein HMPREF9697_00203 [Afipia felis ATCC 53690]SUU76384.1 Predicted nucleotide-binding protein containing TIR-like domain [Afipia felis]SUU84451.1 Predicted nucleotide-binding protein containing TIR-like domain [Afipia felis]